MKTTSKIIISLVCIIIVFLIIRFLGNYNKYEDSGTIHIIVIDEKQNHVIDQEIEFQKNQSLNELLKENFDIEERNGFLYRIENVDADGKDYFLKIYVNCEPASQGINTLSYRDGDVIMFVYTKVGDYHNPC